MRGVKIHHVIRRIWAFENRSSGLEMGRSAQRAPWGKRGKDTSSEDERAKTKVIKGTWFQRLRQAGSFVEDAEKKVGPSPEWGEHATQL